jgi:dihydrofolate reductase
MTTFYDTASSLDGFIADARNSLDWLLRFGEPEPGYFDSLLRKVGAMAMGSTTYEWILANQVHKDPAKPQPWPYRQPAWVFTTRALPAAPDADIRFVRGDVRPVHEAMRKAAGAGSVWILGGGELAGQFLDAGLLDEVRVSVAPVTLGAGAPLLPRRIAEPPLRLVSVARLGEAFAQLRYEVLRWPS